MKKCALLFAGQGAQRVGMGKDFAENFPLARALCEQANSALGYDLARICFEGPESELTKTDNAQPGIYLVSWVAFQLLREQVPDLAFGATAGLSLGEFTALAAAGVFSFEEGLRLVRLRGQFMQEACAATEGAMAAILGLDELTVADVCAETGVEVANLNCPGQIVISGESALVIRACDLAIAKGAKRALPLPVAGAYHSRLMRNAQPKLRAALNGTSLRPPSVPVLANVSASPHGSAGEIVESLITQVTASVRWEASMRWLLDRGFDCFIEFGPGTALSGFLKRIDSKALLFNIADAAGLETTVRALSRFAAS